MSARPPAALLGRHAARALSAQNGQAVVLLGRDSVRLDYLGKAALSGVRSPHQAKRCPLFARAKDFLSLRLRGHGESLCRAATLGKQMRVLAAERTQKTVSVIVT